MDFFGQQERARSNTRRLVFLFATAVALTNLTVYLALAGVFRWTYLFKSISSQSVSHQGWLVKLARHFGADGIWNWELLGWVTLGIALVVGLVSSYKLWQLSRGGAAVAELLGGRLLDLHTSDADERRLFNVVEEMAIAAGVPVPDVYLLDDEAGINAFAAGNEVSHAALGVTFGALKLLNRDELQGMIAHEFSHILNGDMRLNTRLIGWLHGILGLVILGRILTLSFLRGAGAAEDDQRPWPIIHPAFLPAFVLGWICIVAGSFGAFFARMVKSAVSRQREYLADAAAVQFTRNPDGIAGALKKIGGLGRRSLMSAARAEEASHMYFSDGMRQRWFGFTATHPPLTKRIQRINPHFDGKYPQVSLERVLRESRITALYREQEVGRPVDFEKLASVIGASAAVQEVLYAEAARKSGAAMPAAALGIVVPLPPASLSPAHLEYAALFLQTVPAAVRAATGEPFGAVALLYGMICSKDPETRARQIVKLTETTEPGIVSELNLLLPVIDKLDAGAFLPLGDLSIRALRGLSPDQYENFRSNLRQLIEADQQIDLFEYMLERMIVRHLDLNFRTVKRPPVQYYRLGPLIPDCAVLLSGLARIGQDTEAKALAAFQNGAAQLTTESGLVFLPLTDCNLPQIDAALHRVAQASPQLKQQILNALACAAATDGQLLKREAELLRAIADTLDLRIPPYLCATSDALQ